MNGAGARLLWLVSKQQRLTGTLVSRSTENRSREIWQCMNEFHFMQCNAGQFSIFLNFNTPHLFGKLKDGHLPVNQGLRITATSKHACNSPLFWWSDT